MISGEAGYPVILAKVTLGERQVDLLIGTDRAEVAPGVKSSHPSLYFSQFSSLSSVRGWTVFTSSA